jgi:anti-sigma B factor antagonist
VKLTDDPANSLLEVHIERAAGRSLVISVRGEIDMQTAPRLDHAFAACGHTSDVLVDLSEVTFLDSSALQVLVLNAKKLNRAGCQMRLEGLSEHQCKLIRITGLTAVLGVADPS